MFAKEKRIFIELVSGCINKNCTSPCFAVNKELSFMHEEIAEQLIIKYKRYDYQVCLYGQGDSSTYSHFDKISQKTLKKCIVIITQQNLNIIEYLKESGVTVYVRLDVEPCNNDYKWIKMANGCFSVVSMDNLEWSISTATKLLNKGMPFMLRSLCNTIKKVPPYEYILSLMEPNKPKDIMKCVLPEIGCNVTTIREENGGLLIKKCILHDSEEEYKRDPPSKWSPVTNPENFCFECHKNDDYRLYYG